jgi:hypothetical protein
MNVMHELWVAVGGSIYTERAELKKSEFTGKKMDEPQRDTIAFNVGSDVAAHLVKLHNEWYNSKGPGWIKKHNEWAEAVGSEHWER